jgi:hypothetical protein
MKIQLITLIFLNLVISSFGQDSTSAPEVFTIKLENSVLKTWNSQNQIVFEKNFNNPFSQDVDLDGDDINEFVVTDEYTSNGKSLYTLYVFNTIDSFYIADSINSGLMKPVVEYSDEFKGIILLTGNDKFDSFNSDSDEVFLPLNVWKYESSKIISLNDELYDIFISTNDSLIDFIDSFVESNKGCDTVKKLQAIIAAVYVNYLTAGEKTLAEQFLNKYYLCSDLKIFQDKILSLLKGR